MIDVKQLVWDSWNVEHMARHGVLPDEVEQVCQRRPFVEHGYSGRLRLIGSTTTHRVLAVILAPKAIAGVYYPVTARPASRKERRHYQQYHEQQGGEAA